MGKREFEDSDVWAIAFGGNDRDYFEDVFQRYDVALVGCDGVKEPWSEELKRNPPFRSLGKNRRTTIETLCSRIKVDDLVIAKLGMKRARAVGVVVAGYEFNPDWEEVQAWDLFHQIRVIWHPLDQDHVFEGRPFPFRQSTAHHVNNEAAVHWARELAEQQLRSETAEGDLAELPDEQEPLEGAEVPSWFGNAKASAERLTKSWGWDNISEASTITHIIVPMLLDLGWTQEQIRLEHDWVDIAVFDDPDEEPILLIEAKAPRFGASAALQQVRHYREVGETKKGWNKGQIPVLATNGLSFIMLTDDDKSRFEAFVLKPTTKACGFLNAMKSLAPRG